MAAEAVRVEVLRVEGDRDPLELVVDAAGTRWATARALAGWLGYSSHREILRLADRYAADVAEFRSVVSLTTEAGRRTAVVFGERGWYRLAFLAQTTRGQQLRALFGDWLHDEAKLRRATEGSHDALGLAQDIVRSARRRLEVVAKGLPRKSDEREAVESLCSDLKEQRRVLAVAAEGVYVVAERNRLLPMKEEPR